MLRGQGSWRATACLAAALLLASQQAKPCAAQQVQYSPGRGGTAYTPTALAAINKAAPAPAPAAGKDGAAGGSARPEPPAPNGGGSSQGGPPPYTVLAAIIVGAGLCISVVACLCVRRLAMITHTRRLAQATDVLEERRRRAIAMTELSRHSASTKPLAPVHVVIMPDASISFAVELNTAGEFVSSDLAVEGAAADVAAAVVAGQLGSEADEDGSGAGVGTDAAVFAEDIADAENGGITITRLRVHRSASSAGSGSQRRRSPAAGSPGARPQSSTPLAQYLAWEAIRMEIGRGNVPSRGNMLLLGSLSPLSGHPPGDPAAAVAAASAGAPTAATVATDAETAAPAAGSAETAADAPGPAASGVTTQAGPAQGWMAAARDSLARGSSRLMYGSAGDLPQAALERASSQGLQRTSAAGGPPARSRSGGRLPRISGSTHGGAVGGTGGVLSSAGSGGNGDAPARQGSSGGSGLSSGGGGGGDAALGPVSSSASSGLPWISGDAPAHALSSDRGGHGGAADPASVFMGEAVPAARAATALAGGRFGQPRQQGGALAGPTAGQLTTAHATTAGHGPQDIGSATGSGGSTGAGANGSSMPDPAHQPAAPTELPTPLQHPSRPGSPPPSPQRSGGGLSLPDSGAGSPMTAHKSQSGELRQKFGLAEDESSGRSSPGP